MNPPRSPISLAAANRSFGLDCTLAGLSLAGVPLLRKTASGLEPRSDEELEALLKSAYDVQIEVSRLKPSLSIIADAINSDQLGRAMITAMRLPLPELNWDQAAKIARAELRLANYNSSELRDWLGQWASGGRSHADHRAKPSSAKPNSPSRAMHAPAITPMRLAGAEVVIGGGPEEPAGDLAAGATLAVAYAASLMAANRRRPSRRSSSRDWSRASSSNDEECDEILQRDMINCQIVRATKGIAKSVQCRETATARYAECVTHGPSNIRTPLYWGN